MDNNNTMQELLDAYDGGFKAPRRGEVVEGKVVMVNDDEVVVNIGYKADGVIPKSEIAAEDAANLREKYQEGQELDVYVLKTDDGDGNVLLSVKRLVIDQDFKELEPIHEAGGTIPVQIRQVVKGGVIAYYKNVRGFIPASHLSLRYERDMTKYNGQTVDVKIIEYDKRKKRAVFSRKEILREEQAEKREKFFENIEEGEIVEGVVKRLANFGAFVDIGGFDGLVHISEITYGRIKSPGDYLKVNDVINVKVLNINKEEEKISLSLKRTKDNPWDHAAEKYQINSVHEGKVVNTTDFGAFIELEPGVEGLVHISQISVERIDKPSDVLKEGQSYDFEVLEIDPIDKKIKLSRKSLVNQEEALPEGSEYDDEDSADYQPTDDVDQSEESEQQDLLDKAVDKVKDAENEQVKPDVATEMKDASDENTSAEATSNDRAAETDAEAGGVIDIVKDAAKTAGSVIGKVEQTVENIVDKAGDVVQTATEKIDDIVNSDDEA